MIVKALPPLEILRQRLGYDPNTGTLRWVGGRLKGKLAGSRHCRGYALVGFDGVQYMAHRIIWKLVHGEEPVFIDHIDGCRSNNRLANIRSVERGGNATNARLRADNKYGIAGIKLEPHGKWTAKISKDGVTHYLGTYSTKEEAAHAREMAKAALGFSESHGSQDRPQYQRSGGSPARSGQETVAPFS